MYNKYPRLVRLESLLAGCQITREELAKNMGISYGKLSRYISGNTDISLMDMRLIATILSEKTGKKFTIWDVFEKEVV
jgi:transcriptional regulator with XRE-family HTH domain